MRLKSRYSVLSVRFSDILYLSRGAVAVGVHRTYGRVMRHREHCVHVRTFVWSSTAAHAALGAAYSTPLSGKIAKNQWNHRKSLEIIRNQWKSKEIDEYQWKSLKLYSFPWFPMATHAELLRWRLSEPRPRRIVSKRMLAVSPDSSEPFQETGGRLRRPASR